MFLAILMLLFTAILAPFLENQRGGCGGFKKRCGYLVALPSATIFGHLLWQSLQSSQIQQWPLLLHLPWAGDLGLDLQFRLDGWAALFALLITGIGTLVLIYAKSYLEDHPQLGRFQAETLVFMAAMLGVVLSDNFLLLFVFWELTSISSYLLIGFNHTEEKARKAALQALLVTGLGGLAMLSGLVLLGFQSSAWHFTALLEKGVDLQNPLTSWALVLILLGALSKSAQWPFHFWLPNAMEAPTPASAYLHSSTMVKAGIFLMGRLLPVLGEHPLWAPVLQTLGGMTFLYGAWMVLRTSYAKRLLAYTTLSALGMLTFLLGFGGEKGGQWALQACVLWLLGHGLYKGSLFLLAGALDHACGEKDLQKMSGLGKALPTLKWSGLLAAASMLGLLPFFGFLGKEALLEALVKGGVPWPLLLLALLALALLGSAGLAVGLKPFVGEPLQTAKTPHHPPLALWLPPFLLGLTGALIGLLPFLTNPLMNRAVQDLLPRAKSPEGWTLALWHGLNLPFSLGLIALGLALALYLYRAPLFFRISRWPSLALWGPDQLYNLSLKGMLKLAEAQTRVLQTGYLKHYLWMVLGCVILLPWLSLLALDWKPDFSRLRDLYLHEVGLGLVIAISAFGCIYARSRMLVVIALGLVGYSIALIFLIYGAPDLAMTQFAVETLTVLLFVLTLRKLPPFFRSQSRKGRFIDISIAAGIGLTMALLTLMASQASPDLSLSRFFLENSYPGAHGRNVVNVILVDFRGLDTLGEITVLAVVAIGSFALLKLRLAPDLKEKGDSGGAAQPGSSALKDVRSGESL